MRKIAHRQSSIAEQHWLHEPTTAEIKEENSTLRSWLLAVGVIALCGWVFFAVAVALR